MPHRRLLALLASKRNEIDDLENSVRDQLEGKRQERDNLVLRAVAERIPERLISHAAGISRAWIHRLKRNGVQ